ncbi:heavy metal-associated isoprenylated plant protein 19 [Actinidia eriantha]|uniref:heavy metal-associated isoprenylated plant protein 19 n=1 Tax=Actinidia eriantha TaxID=165200 RepID=UPI00259092BA|nr:heavy metal-associated isoprenylated plant protein 19 [Actinidia eriantha]
MAKNKKNGKEDKKVVVVEFTVSMHCNACERTVAKAISKIKGVEKFVTDMTRNRVIVTGRINPHKVVKKLRKKTGKRVEIVMSKEEDSKDAPNKEEDVILAHHMITRSMVLGYCGDTSAISTLFSDENPNACSIM